MGIMRLTCGAKTRAGHPCRRKGTGKGGRCLNHGGRSTGPRTIEGRERIASAQRARWQRWQLYNARILPELSRKQELRHIRTFDGATKQIDPQYAPRLMRRGPTRGRAPIRDGADAGQPGDAGQPTSPANLHDAEALVPVRPHGQSVLPAIFPAIRACARAV
jgi:hypothetical protein